jgi:hypothetical protein
MMGTDLLSHDAVATALRSVGEAAAKNRQSGKEALLRAWSYTAESRVGRSVSDRDKLHIFNADGFWCRYTGELLLLPAFLRTLSALYPDACPYHRNWKSEETHPSYWSHNAIGGAEHRDNWVTRAWPAIRCAAASASKRSAGNFGADLSTTSGMVVWARS